MTPAAGPSDAPPPPFFGRSELRESLEVAIGEAGEGTGRGILIRGPGGVGKSALLRTATAFGRHRGFRVAAARALPDELPAPFSLVRDLVAALADDGVAPIDPVAEGAFPPILVPLLDPAPLPGDDAGPVVASRTPSEEIERILAPVGATAVEGLGAGRDRLFVELVDHFLALARERPLLLAIDDLPFADPSSLEFVRRLADELPDASIALAATAGLDAELPAESREPIAALARAPTFRVLELRPLTVEELTEFVAWLQGGAAPAAADVERWHAQTEGNPLFVEQLVRAAIGGLVSDAGAATAHDLVAVLMDRIHALDDTERKILTYAAILGREFDFERLAAVAGIGEERLTEGIDRLVLAGLLREKGDEVYEFVSEAARAGVYAELTETRRRILHRRVGEALEARGRSSDFELARQFYLGRDPAKTVEYNLRAAETAARAFALDAAVSHLTRALDAERRRTDRDPRREVRLLTEFGRLKHETGDLVRSEEALAAAVDLARAGRVPDVELGRATIALAWTRGDRGMYAEAESLALEALHLLEPSGTPQDLLSAHRVLGNVYWRIADLPRAEAHQRLALEIAERSGTPLEQGHALVDVANTLIPLGSDRFEAALGLYARAADLFASGEAPSARARVLMNRAVLEYGAGRSADAFRDLEEALVAAERSRSPLWIGFCLLNLAQWKAEGGDPKAATTALERAERALTPLHDRLSAQQLAMTHGMIAEAEGAYPAAEAAFRDSLAKASEMHLGAETAELLFRLAQLAHRTGDLPAARAWLEEAVDAGVADHRPDLAPRVRELAGILRPAADRPG